MLPEMSDMESSGGTKISVVVPVYNEEKSIVTCLAALLNQDYPKENYEIVVVNDGSTDCTNDIVEKYPVRLVNLNRNVGRIIAREIGARVARHDTLYFVDSRIIPDPDVLTSFVRIGYQPNIGGEEYLEKYRSLFDAFFYLVRRKIYKPYYPQYFYEEGADYYYIDEMNFNNAPKGMSNMFISRELFLSAIPKDKCKMINDDTRLFKEIVGKKRILRHSDIRFKYLQRTGFQEVIKHIYERGPRFADYYLASGGKYRAVYLVGLAGMVFFLLFSMFRPALFLLGGMALILLNIAVSVWLMENRRDFFIAFLLLLPVSAAFCLGILKWQVRCRAA